jgi:hypothetical protein
VTTSFTKPYSPPTDPAKMRTKPGMLQSAGRLATIWRQSGHHQSTDEARQEEQFGADLLA